MDPSAHHTTASLKDDPEIILDLHNNFTFSFSLSTLFCRLFFRFLFNFFPLNFPNFPPVLMFFFVELCDGTEQLNCVLLGSEVNRELVRCNRLCSIWWRRSRWRNNRDLQETAHIFLNLPPCRVIGSL